MNSRKFSKPISRVLENNNFPGGKPCFALNTASDQFLENLAMREDTGDDAMITFEKSLICTYLKNGDGGNARKEIEALIASAPFDPQVTKLTKRKNISSNRLPNQPYIPVKTEEERLTKELKEVRKKKESYKNEISELSIKHQKATLNLKMMEKKEAEIMDQLEKEKNEDILDISDDDDTNNDSSYSSTSLDLSSIDRPSKKTKKVNFFASSPNPMKQNQSVGNFKDYNGPKYIRRYGDSEIMKTSGAQFAKKNAKIIKGPLMELFRGIRGSENECTVCFQMCPDDDDLKYHIGYMHPTLYNKMYIFRLVSKFFYSFPRHAYVSLVNQIISFH